MVLPALSGRFVSAIASVSIIEQRHSLSPGQRIRRLDCLWLYVDTSTHVLDSNTVDVFLNAVGWCRVAVGIHGTIITRHAWIELFVAIVDDAVSYRARF